MLALMISMDEDELSVISRLFGRNRTFRIITAYNLIRSTSSCVSRSCVRS